jgi:hypothetical protein
MNWSLPQDEAHLLLDRSGPVAAFPLPEPDHWRLIDATGTSTVGRPGTGNDPGSIVGRFQELLSRTGIKDAAIVQPIWTSAFHIGRRVVNHLRVGRCFLTGDAAHIHSPVGGQGMNTGIQDACNLAWKLALVVGGESADALLDSYEAERLPVAETVLRGTDRATWIATLRNPVGRAVRDWLTASLSGFSLVRRRLTRELSELGVAYRHSPIVAEDWQGGFASTAPRPGDRVPDVALTPAPGGPLLGRPARLFDVLYGTHHTLLLFEGSEARLDGIANVARERWAGQVDTYDIARPEAGPGCSTDETGIARQACLADPDGRLHRLFDARSACLYLIRPDGHVGYRARPPDPDRFTAYLGRVLR